MELHTTRKIRNLLIIISTFTMSIFIYFSTFSSKDIKADYFSNNTKEVRMAYEENPQGLDVFNEKGLTPLMFAINENNLQAAKFLLAQKADPNARTDDGVTALYFAIVNRNTRMVELLAKNGADINQPVQTVGSSSGFVYVGTPLVLAIKHHDLSIVRTLIENGADVNLGGEIIRADGTLVLENDTPLMAAVSLKNKDVDIIRLLIKSGANINATARDYSRGKPADLSTSLTVAIQHGNLEIVKLLVENGADTNLNTTVDNTLSKWMPMTPVVIAIKYKQLEILKYLVEKGASLNGAGTFALMFSSDFEILAYLAQVTSDDSTKKLKQAVGVRIVHAERMLKVAEMFVNSKKDVEKMTGTNLMAAIDIFTTLSLLTENERKKTFSTSKSSLEDTEKALKYVINELDYRNQLYKSTTKETAEAIYQYYAKSLDTDKELFVMLLTPFKYTLLLSFMSSPDE